MDNNLLGTDVTSLVPMNLDAEPQGYEADEREDPTEKKLGPTEEADLSGDPFDDGQVEAAAIPMVMAFTATHAASNTEVRQMLQNLGWRIRTTGELKQAIRNFQAAVILDGELVVDGIAGPKTTAKLRLCEKRRKAGLPTASAHFSFLEFRCKCGGRFSNCARIWVKRRLIHELESYRKGVGHGITIVSGCRCPGHNKAVGGATLSRHMRGDAADFPPAKKTTWFFLHSLFDGRGYNPAHLVRHGDMRGAHITWRYGS